MEDGAVADSPPHAIDLLFAAAVKFQETVYPGLPLKEVSLTFLTGDVAKFPLHPSASMLARNPVVQKALSVFQRAIMDALDGRGMTADELGARIGDRSRLYKQHGIQELVDKGLVQNDPDQGGYYRPDAPPEGK